MNAVTVKILRSVLAWGALLIILVPLLWMIASSFKPTAEILQGESIFLPHSPTLTNFQEILSGPAPTMIRNSLIVAGLSTLIVLVLGSMAGYSLAMGSYRGKEVLGRVILLNYMFPILLMVVPIYIIFTTLGLTDNLVGLTIVYIALSLPFAIWLLRSFFSEVPKELEMAARVEGISRFSTFTQIVLPQVTPGILSVGIFAFIQSWNEFLLAFVFLSSAEKMTIPVGMNYQTSQLEVDWGPLMALSVFTMVPVIILFTLGQKFLKSGIGIGAVKG